MSETYAQGNEWKYEVYPHSSTEYFIPAEELATLVWQAHLRDRPRMLRSFQHHAELFVATMCVDTSQLSHNVVDDYAATASMAKVFRTFSTKIYRKHARLSGYVLARHFAVFDRLLRQHAQEPSHIPDMPDNPS